MEPNIELVAGETMRLCIECDVDEHSIEVVLEARQEALNIQELMGLVKFAGLALPLRLRRAPGGVWEQLYQLPPLTVERAEDAPQDEPGPDSGPVGPDRALQAALAAKGGTAASLLISGAQQFTQEVMEEQGLSEDELERRKWELHINNNSSINRGRDFARRVRQGIIEALRKEGKPLGSTELAHALGVSPPAALRHLRRMEKEGLIIVAQSWIINGVKRARYTLPSNGKKDARP